MKLQVGVKALIKNDNEEFLLVRRSDSFEGCDKRQWDIPGGRIETNETLQRALAREVAEETGMVLEGSPRLLAAQDIMVEPRDLRVVRLTYLAAADGNVTLSGEHSEYRWADMEQALILDLDIYVREVINNLMGESAGQLPEMFV